MASILNNINQIVDPNRGSGEGYPEIVDEAAQLASEGGGMLLLVVPPKGEDGYTVHPFTATMTLNGTSNRAAVGHVMDQIKLIVLDRMFPSIEPNKPAKQTAEDGAPVEDGDPRV